MVPGITDTECRIAQFRYRELHAVADRHRRAAHAAPVAGRGGLMEMMQRQIGALMERGSRILTHVRTQEMTDHPAAPGTLAVSK